MSRASYRSGFAQRWRAFGKSDLGNVAVIFAIAIIPAIGLVGAAIDYSAANSMRARMQAAADSAALAVSREAATLSNSQLQTKAKKYFEALFTDGKAQNVQISATYKTTPNSHVIINASATTKPRFMSMAFFGISQMPVSVSSTTEWGNIRLRVALALDNTGSMKDDGKMDALQSAATKLLDQLKDAARKAGDVYVSIIPFSKDVNVGTGNKNADWLQWSKPGKNSDAWDQNNGECTKSNGTGSYSYDNEYDCENNGKRWNVKNHSTWNGCVMDRDQDYDTTVTPPAAGDSATPSTLFWPEEYRYCPVELMGLSYDWTKLKSKINTMQPTGATNQAIGLAWAWLSLQPTAPMSAPAEDSNFQYQKVIILLSDGLNTQDRWYGNGYQVSTKVDARQKLLCDNVKAAGVTLYTVQVNTAGDPTSTLLQNCASTSDKFFLLTASSQIITTFEEIGTKLSNLRIAK